MISSDDHACPWQACPYTCPLYDIIFKCYTWWSGIVSTRRHVQTCRLSPSSSISSATQDVQKTLPWWITPTMSVTLYCLLNVSVRKLPCFGTEWSELPCKTQPLEMVNKNICPVTLTSFGPLKKRCLQCHIEKKHRMSSCVYLQQTRRGHNKTSGHMINIQSVTDDVSHPLRSGW